MQQENILGQSVLGFHRLAYTEWGTTSNKVPPIICVHGLTRNGRDFDRLSQALQNERHIFCPDMVGRGKSDWLKDPLLYGYPQYMSDLNALIARTGGEQVDWVGTSMGGILGMLLAAMPNSPIRRLVINDVGALIPLSALMRIGSYVGVMPEFIDKVEAERYMRQQYAPFGLTRDEDWQHMTEHGLRSLPNGMLTLNYDPGIMSGFGAIKADVDLWSIFDRIRCPVFLLRGAQSDLLSAETAFEMTQRGPRAKLVEIEGAGHAPGLADENQIGLVSAFLRQGL